MVLGSGCEMCVCLRVCVCVYACVGRRAVGGLHTAVPLQLSDWLAQTPKVRRAVDLIRV